MKYITINIEGPILSPDILDAIENGDRGGQGPKDFGFDVSIKVKDEIARSWADAQELWRVFKSRMERVKEDEFGASETRRYWIIPFLGLLGYDVEFQQKAEVINEKSYPISHKAINRDGFPIHIMGFRDSLDRRRTDSGPRMSPHALLQEYLNMHEHLFGIVTNGLQLRLLRDAGRLIKLSYLEFDLDRMFEEDYFADFAMMYRLIHATRMPARLDAGSESIMEKYHQDALDSGARIRDGLSEAVHQSIISLAAGFLNDPANEKLRKDIREKRILAETLYHNLLRLIYRVLFLMVIEERNLIFPPKVETLLQDIYYQFFGIDRLRLLAERRILHAERHSDLWEGLLRTFSLFEEDGKGRPLGIRPLAGDLFHQRQSIGILSECALNNAALLDSIKNLGMFVDKNTGHITRVNYASLSVEEFGSVYEGMLDYHPFIAESHGKMSFDLIEGKERKTTGSYYTPPELVAVLIKSALEPVVQERKKGSVDPGKSILSMRVCDPACGSGHFLLAAARYMARELAMARSGGEEPSPEITRQSLRDVISHCIYGVDKNPLAVELCKVALWIEGHEAGKPLTFLDHRIKCGDSLVGVLDLEVLKKGIPDGAFLPVTGDDRDIARQIKKINHSFTPDDHATLFDTESPGIMPFAQSSIAIEDMPDDTIDSINKKARAYEKMHDKKGPWYNSFTACNMWTSAFFSNLKKKDFDEKYIVTNEILFKYLHDSDVDHRYTSNADSMAIDYRFFHWPLEFPEVFEKGGFDCVLGNPPWERIKLQEKEFFASRDPEIANAANKAEREKLILKLKKNNPELLKEFEVAKHAAECQSKFIRESQRFPLTAVGDINTYAVFSETTRSIISKIGRLGIIVPTGIATDDTTKKFFSDLIQKQSLSNLIAFENEAFIFPGIHHAMKFCALTLLGTSIKVNEADFMFFCKYFSDLNDKTRHFTLSPEEIQLLNPNTLTCPIFRTRIDAELTKKVYSNVPVIEKEEIGENPWGISFMTMFHMSNDSYLFKNEQTNNCLPLYEAKMFFKYDHRYSTYEGATQAQLNTGTLPQLTDIDKEDPNKKVLPRYWIEKKELNEIIIKDWNYRWFVCLRGIAQNVNEHTLFCSIIPQAGIANSAPVIIAKSINPLKISLLLSNLCSLICDYITRQKVGGSNLNFFILKQIPILQPTRYLELDINFIIPRVIELVYTAWDIKTFADDLWNDSDIPMQVLLKEQLDNNKKVTGGHEWAPPNWVNINNDGIPLPPFKWDPERRALIRAELDAYYAKLYGLTRDELRYILDPADVYGPEFPGETFRVLKEREIKQYGEFRTRRLVLEAWDRLFE